MQGAKLIKPKVKIGGVGMPTRISGAAKAVTAKAPVEMPAIIELDPADARPSILLQGGSGTGKTHALERMLAAGYNGLLVLVENKWQDLAKYRPKSLLLSAPINGKPPTNDQLYDRLFYFLDQLAEGKYRKHDGKFIDFIGFDGALEIGNIIYKYWKKRKPISKTGEQNTFALWDNVGERAADFFRGARDAAGAASALFGFPPVGIICTVGEHAERGKLGSTFYEPLFPGRKGPEAMPYCFSQVIRLSCRNNDGKYEYVAHTIGTEEFYAKCPPKLFEAEELNPDFGKMYAKLVAHYEAKEEESKDE